jgi:hypothetical protein
MHSKPILAVPAWGETLVPPDIRERFLPHLTTTDFGRGEEKPGIDFHAGAASLSPKINGESSRKKPGRGCPLRSGANTRSQ